MSTIKSTQKQWTLIYVISFILVLGGGFAFETHWRNKGYTPSVMDSFDLWSLHRARAAKPAPPLRVALAGASRIQYGISPDVFRDESAKLGLVVDPIMLAINGHYPLATLHDLAMDKNFVGVVIVGIDGRGMNPAVWNMQQKHIDYFHREWSPSKEFHRRALTAFQQKLIATRADFSVIALLKRVINGEGPPPNDYVTFNRDRSGGTDYSKTDVKAIANYRVTDLTRYYKETPTPSPEVWRKSAEEIIGWVRQINARGGRVVFYREPLSGGHIALDEAHYPRALYWDKLAAAMPALMIDFRDYPTLNFETPDTSHIDIKDIDAHTRALVKVLNKAGIFTPAK